MVEDISMSTENFIKNYNKNADIRCTSVKGIGYLLYFIGIRIGRAWDGHFMFWDLF